MRFGTAALAALLAIGAFVGIEALLGGPGAPTGPVPPVADSAPPGPGIPTAGRDASDLDARRAVAEAERDRLRMDLQATAAERDALAATLAARDAAAAARAMTETADATDAQAEIDALLGELAARAAEIDRLKSALAARDAELANLRDLAKILPVAADPEILSRVRVAPARDGGDFAARLEAAKTGLPLPRPEQSAPAPAADAPLAIVLFERASARLTAGGADRAAEAAATLAALDPARIRVTGHSDTTGDPAQNMRLSRARAETVVAALVAAGLPANRIEIAAHGQTADLLPIPTGEGVAEPLNRCAGIYLVAAAG